MTELYYCRACGTIERPTKKTKGSMGVEIVLWLCFLLPGLIYSVWRLTSKYEGCSSCGSPDVIPASSPHARESITRAGREAEVQQIATKAIARAQDTRLGLAVIGGVAGIALGVAGPVAAAPIAIGLLWWPITALMPGAFILRLVGGLVGSAVLYVIAIAIGNAFQ